MLSVRKSEDRGHADHGWLKTQHTFSFADYYDPKHMAFRSLRVINEDHIAGGQGFPPHSHRDMEIITYIVSGALEHKDSKGNQAVIYPGEVQKMSAGRGVQHSEYNHHPDLDCHLLQIWIMPDKTGIDFSYGQKSFTSDLQTKKLVLTASGDGRDGSIVISQDVDLYVSRLKRADRFEFTLRENRHAWLQLIKGSLRVNNVAVKAGDGLAASGESRLEITAGDDSEFLLFDLA